MKIYADAIEGGDTILAIVRADADEPAAVALDDERLERAFNALSSPRIPPPAPSTYVEMVSEGQLSSLRSTALRDKLAEYDRVLGVVQEVSRNVSDFAVTQTPILNRHFASRSVVDEHSLSGIREQVLSHDVPGMRDDPDFAIAVTLPPAERAEFARTAQDSHRVDRGDHNPTRGGATTMILRRVAAAVAAANSTYEP